MRFPKYLFFIISIICVIFVSYFICSLFHIRLFTWNGYDFFAFGILFAFLHFTEQNLRFNDSIISVVLLAIMDTYFRKKTAFGGSLSSFLLFFYSLSAFFLSFFAFHFIWFKKNFRIIRNVLFSILAAAMFSIVHFAVSILKSMKWDHSFLFYSLLIMLTISFALTLAEVFFGKLEKIWTIPERIVHENNEKEEAEDD